MQTIVQSISRGPYAPPLMIFSMYIRLGPKVPMLNFGRGTCLSLGPLGSKMLNNALWLPNLVRRTTDASLTLKEPGAESVSPSTFFCYISAGCYFFALKLHDFFSSSHALNLRPFKKKKNGPTVMTRRCVIERWVQRKTDQKLIFNGSYTQIVFFCFQDTLSLFFILFIWFIWIKNMCKHTLTHIIAKKCNFCLKK